MKKQSILLTLLTTGALLISGCSNNATTGAVIGSLAGAGIGKATSNHSDRRAGVGAVIGGIVGAAIGAEKDRANRNKTQTATTSPYYQKPHTVNTEVKHAHKYASGNKTHTHKGGTTTHSHSNTQDDAEYVYVEDSYPTTSSTVIIHGGYHHPRRYNHRRYNNRRYHHRSYHNKKHYRNHRKHYRNSRHYRKH